MKAPTQTRPETISLVLGHIYDLRTIRSLKTNFKRTAALYGEQFVGEAVGRLLWRNGDSDGIPRIRCLSHGYSNFTDGDGATGRKRRLILVGIVGIHLNWTIPTGNRSIYG